MVLGPTFRNSHRQADKDPMQLAQFPLAVPYLLNPVGIVGLMTISAEAKSLSVFAVEFGILVFVLLLDVVVFRWANRVSEKLDENRMLVTEKVFGFLIAAIAVQLVLDGLAMEGIIAPVRTKALRDCIRHSRAVDDVTGSSARLRSSGSASPRQVTPGYDQGIACCAAWTGAPDNPTAASAVNAMVRVICAASAHGVRGRASHNPPVVGSSHPRHLTERE